MCDSEANCLLLSKGDKLRDFEVGNNNFIGTEVSEIYNPAQTAENSYVCSICHRTFTLKGNLERHAEEKHGLVLAEDKRHKCLICNKSFKRKRAVKRHSIVHTRKNKYTCSICHITFKQKDALRKHSLVHGKPHACNVCNKTFTQRNSLIAHKLLHVANKSLTERILIRQKTTDFSPSQLEKFIQFMEEHPDLNSGNLYSDKRKDLWLKLLESLNEDNLGPKKTISQWRNCWSLKKMNVCYKVKQRKVLSAIEKRMLPLIGYKIVERKSPSREEIKELNPSDQLITGLSVDYENSPELDEQIGNCRENIDLSTEKQKLENEENYFADAHSLSSCENQSMEEISALKRIAVAFEKQALAAEKQALAIEKQQAALKILATQSIQNNETLSEIVTIMEKIA